MKPEQIIAIACEQAECEEKLRLVHFHQYLHKGWNPHPPPEFVAWWMPDDVQEGSGASVGGQIDALRVHARKTSEGWVRGTYGLNAVQAWNTACYRERYDAWVRIGAPESDEPCVSVALPLAEQRAFLARLLAGLALGMPDEGELT